jgi:hypothetical protein
MNVRSAEEPTFPAGWTRQCSVFGGRWETGFDLPHAKFRTATEIGEGWGRQISVCSEMVKASSTSMPR